MASSFSWLDYSEREKRQMLDVISKFRERDTRDELGVGSIRDAFADIFFPGTSTIQTRIRYFLFIPWIYKGLENKNSMSGNIEQRARSDEMRLVYGLLKTGEKEGVIGSDAKEKLRRLPSNIYWQGLAAWGIRLFKGSQSQYHSCIGKEKSISLGSFLNDDKEPMGGALLVNWHAGLPQAPKGFPDECTLKLSNEEALYLQERICFNLHNTLLAFLAEHGRACDPCEFPWLHPQYASFPEEIRMLLDHARNFSETQNGASLLYNLMLAELTKNETLIESYQVELRGWAIDTIGKRIDTLINWVQQIDMFWQILQRPPFRIPTLTERFVRRWLTLLLKPGDTKNISENADARILIHEREQQLKHGLARLDNPRARELWSGASGTSPLDYRWGITQALISDILDGLRGNANAPTGR